MKFRVKTLAVAALATAGLLAGCAHGMVGSAAQTEVMSFVDPGYQTLGAAGRPDQMPRKLAAKLKLTADQQSELRAIMQKYRSSVKPDVMAHRQELKALLVAEQVDAAALKGFIQARVADFEAKAPAQMAMMSEMRRVLTPAQREQVATMLTQPVPARARDHFDGMRHKMRTRLVQHLGLTATQQGALNALADKMDALRDEGPHQALRAGFASFIRTGDPAALQAARQGKLTAKLPVDELVAVATSLSRTQRTQLVEKAETFARFHRR